MATKSLAPAELQIVQQLRDTIAPQKLLPDNKLNSDWMLYRGLKANKMSVVRAEKMFQEYERVIKLIETPDIYTEIYPKDFDCLFKVHIGGKDRLGRPIIAVPNAKNWHYSKMLNQGQEMMFKRYIRRISDCLEMALIKENSESAIILIDAKDGSVGQFMHRRVIPILVELATHYENISPGVITKVIVVNATKFAAAFINNLLRYITKIVGSIEIKCYGSKKEEWFPALCKEIPEEYLTAEFGGKFVDYKCI